MDKQNKRVVALGELLVDFTENGNSAQGNQLLEANPGGAPCNVLAMLGQLGFSTAFVGKVGQDRFGSLLRHTLQQVGIDATYLYEDEAVHTTLAFVHTLKDGDRDFSFYRNPGADMMLSVHEVPDQFIRQADLFHFGTLSMTHEGVREATKKAILLARDGGSMISFDPNIRMPLWDSAELAKEQTAYGMRHCDILKISDNELRWFTGKEDFDEGIQILRSEYDIKLIVLSMGRDGSRAYYKNLVVDAAPFLQKETVETTGAGDSFCGCVLGYVLEHGLESLTERQLSDMLQFANAAASIVTTRKGALRVMPDRDEVLALIRKGTA